ncbi:hypothetical protein PRUPE_1G321300 [Prunus persica]|uniref:Uncharacterized protein n=1 Tax=Prunus persica TaxID=3760 RepID=A0A251R784_PRUPE|nr:hypothetical protein PRUPE_1G321300 [Prunus persica]
MPPLSHQYLKLQTLDVQLDPTPLLVSVRTLIEAVKLEFKAQGFETQLPEFPVFFNDHVANDFNTLFKAFPIDRTYMAAGVPGSFHGRLFPKASMNLMHSSFAVQWLTRVPQEVTKEVSPAWNKGRITYARNESSKVEEAYAAQFARDMKAFFTARSAELADDGLLAILMPCRPEPSLPSESTLMNILECLGDALADMVKESLLSEAAVDSFNLPIYVPSASEVEGVILLGTKNKNLVVVLRGRRKCASQQSFLVLSRFEFPAFMQELQWKTSCASISDPTSMLMNFSRDIRTSLKNSPSHLGLLALRTWQI